MLSLASLARRSPPPRHAPVISDSSSFTCSSDAAWRSDSYSAGLAWIIKNPEKHVISQGLSSQNLVRSPLIAEALAMRLAVDAAAAASINQVRMESDSTILINALNSIDQPIKIYGIVKDIFTHIQNFLQTLVYLHP